MSNPSFDENNDEPFDYFKEGTSSKPPDNSGLGNLITTIRSDPLLTTDTEPARKNLLERINLKILVGILLGLFIIIFLIFLLAGPGRPALERNLAFLVHNTGTFTPTSTNSAVIIVTSQATIAPSPSSTPRPTRTPTQPATPTATISLIEASFTPSSDCREALSITLADVGQTMCVKGTVIETVDRPNAFMVIFSDQPGSFYWVSYDMVWSQAKVDTCYQTSGTIQQIANSPILLFDYSNIPEVCP
jgi:hypothetical protein